MDILVNPIVSRLVDTFTGLANKELRLIVGVPEEIQKLCEMLRSIKHVLNDAERRQIAEQGVKQWLSRLSDIMYDADDILDEYQITTEEWDSREHPPEEPSICCRMLPPFACFRRVKFTHEIGSKIRDLNQRLERISADRSKFDLKFDISAHDRQKVVARVRHETSPGVEPNIVGEAIERDTRDLVDLLMRKDEGANANLVALAIVGIGGIGKTTLAQNIFNDDEIKSAFQKKRIWVCVSQEFVETDLLREIITSAGGSPGEARSKAQLENIVMHLLKDSKFLLVLDDVWDAQVWENFFSKPLQVGAIGSKVLVTTRNQRVAERMKAIHIHNVNPLTPRDSWLLLCKKVTKNIEEERDVQSLKDIGMKIVEKCQGLPLAIKVIGGVLCGKLSRGEWELVERSSAWSRAGLPDEIHQALYLSYEDLPSRLKQCFLYCSLFREDSDLHREHLIQLWIAEGFVVKVEGEEYPSLEEIAQGYFDELLHRSLLQNINKAKYEGIYCKMHDLLRSLCHSLARGENSIIRDTHKQLPRTADDEDSIKVRRLSIVAPEYEDIRPFLRSTQRHKSARTLLLEKITSLDDEDIDNCFKNFQCLRVVHLGKTMIYSLPQSVGNLLHLRYLNLSGCGEVKALPESIASLKNLQFLILQGCLSLHTLPKEVVKLHNLRTLDVVNVPLKGLASGIARLEHLNELKGVVVSSISSDSSNSHTNSCSLEEISKLRKLRELSIYNLDMTRDESEQTINGLNGLMALEDLVVLHLVCRSISQQQVESYAGKTKRIEKIFNVALHPPSCMRRILIENFSGRQFPWWLMSSNIGSFLPNLTNLELISCCSCSILPPLGKLPSLEYLVLCKLDAVTSIGAEFFGYEEASTGDGLAHESGRSKSASSSPAFFPRLKRLRLVFFDNLEAWHWVPEDGGTVAMPQLNELEVSHCPKLLSLPEGLNRQAICLTELSIISININSISGFPSIKYLSINNGKSLQIVSHLPALEVLEVHLNEEQSLSLPDWLVQGLPDFTSLQRLDLACENEQLIRMCLQDGPVWPKISHIPIVEIRHRLGNYITYNKRCSTFRTNII